MGPGSDDRGRIVELTVVHTRSEAEMIVSRLRAEGVRATASSDDAGGWGPNIGIEGVRVLVREDDLDAARGLLGPGAAGGGRPGRPRPTKRRPAR